MPSFPYPNLVNVTVLSNYLLELEYDNNEKKVYDFKPNLSHSFFKELENAALFKNVFVNNGELEWRTGQDFCPHTLYDKSVLQV
ncbi:MAG: DUF2442 domain-containing protein [Defluviitaleaceae bacterium]|nr:DUF2442 domain-containing protein [Defluviitaleaceae bacterium]